MPVIAIAPLEKSAAAAFAAAWNLPLVYDEVVERLAGRLGLRRDRVERLLDGSAGLLERLAVDRASLSLLSAEEIVVRAARGAAAGVARAPGGPCARLARARSAATPARSLRVSRACAASRICCAPPMACGRGLPERPARLYSGVQPELYWRQPWH
jgi:hypothetical protein